MNHIPKVYFAGKVSKNCYRTKLLNDRYVMSDIQTYNTFKGQIKYIGPYALDSEHGSSHWSRHSLAIKESIHTFSSRIRNLDSKYFKERTDSYDDYFEDGLSLKEVTHLCLNQIKDSDFIIAYIETLDCYGTLAELGMASALNKQIFLFIEKDLYFKLNEERYDDVKDELYKPHQFLEGSQKLHIDIWFILNLPGVKHQYGFPTFDVIPDNMFYKEKTHKEKYYEYLQSDEWDQKRKAKLKEAKYRCQLCNKDSKLSVHHRTYDNVFHEKLSDLIALCEKCHEKFHSEIPIQMLEGD
jgi:hypothetical protein